MVSLVPERTDHREGAKSGEQTISFVAEGLNSKKVCEFETLCRHRVTKTKKHHGQGEEMVGCDEEKTGGENYRLQRGRDVQGR
jgi:hypothetical protein